MLRRLSLMTKKTVQIKMKNLTKGDLINIFWRNTLGLQLGWNYPRMQGLGYAYTVMPALKRLYKNKKDKMKQALKLEMEFFNTTPQMSHLIVRSEEHTSELQSRFDLVCRLLLEKKNNKKRNRRKKQIAHLKN